MKETAAVKYAQYLGSRMAATIMTSGYRKLKNVSMPPLTYTMAVTNTRSVKIWVIAWSLNSCHRETNTMKKTETVYQTRMMVMKRRVGTLLGVRLTIRSSMASRKDMTMTRTFTSHASHARSLNLVSPICTCSLSSSSRYSRYPESFEIIENSGRYREITMPPTITPRKPIMMGSSKVSMFLVAASTSSS